jgi:hypothetical protein
MTAKKHDEMSGEKSKHEAAPHHISMSLLYPFPNVRNDVRVKEGSPQKMNTE